MNQHNTAIAVLEVSIAANELITNVWEDYLKLELHVLIYSKINVV